MLTQQQKTLGKYWYVRETNICVDFCLTVSSTDYEHINQTWQTNHEVYCITITSKKPQSWQNCRCVICYKDVYATSQDHLSVQFLLHTVIKSVSELFACFSKNSQLRDFHYIIIDSTSSFFSKKKQKKKGKERKKCDASYLTASVLAPFQFWLSW